MKHIFTRVFGLAALLITQVDLAHSQETRVVTKELRQAISNLLQEEVGMVRTRFPKASLELSSRVPDLTAVALERLEGSRGWKTSSNQRLRIELSRVEFNDTLAVVTFERWSPDNMRSESDATIQWVLKMNRGVWSPRSRTLPKVTSGLNQLLGAPPLQPASFTSS